MTNRIDDDDHHHYNHVNAARVMLAEHLNILNTEFEMYVLVNGRADGIRKNVQN